MTPKLEQLILEARQAIIDVKIANKPGGKVDPKMKGYVASLGPSLVYNGLLPAILIYEKEDEKKKISHALYNLIKKTKPDKPKLLSEYLLEKFENRNYKTLRQVADYVIALKLALSLFDLSEAKPANSSTNITIS